MVATGQKVEELDKERDFPVTIFSGLDKPSGVPGLLDSWVTHPAPRPPCGAPVASAPAGGARARLKGAAGSGWPQWRTAAAVRGQERSSRGCSAARTGPSTPGDGHPTALPLSPPHSGPRPAGHPRSVPRIPGSRWPLRPGRPRARCPGRRCCSWLRCSLWPPRRGPQVRACGAPRSVGCLFPCPPACHSGDRCPALTPCCLRACLFTNLCILVGRVRARWVWALDTLRVGDGLGDTFSTRELGCFKPRPRTSGNQGAGTCLSVLEIQAKERKSDFGHREGVGGGGLGSWGTLSLVRLLLGVWVVILFTCLEVGQGHWGAQREADRQDCTPGPATAKALSFRLGNFAAGRRLVSLVEGEGPGQSVIFPRTSPSPKLGLQRGQTPLALQAKKLGWLSVFLRVSPRKRERKTQAFSGLSSLCPWCLGFHLRACIPTLGTVAFMYVISF